MCAGENKKQCFGHSMRIKLCIALRLMTGVPSISQLIFHRLTVCGCASENVSQAIRPNTLASIEGFASATAEMTSESGLVDKAV
jgi:hypothetical protein